MAYRETVETFAGEALELDEDERQTYIAQSVGGCHYIIFYGANEEVLQYSSNEPDGDEVSAMCKPDADWKDMRMMAAYLAMEADVTEKLTELIEEREEAEEEAEIAG